MDRHHWNAWEQIRTRFIGPDRELAIPALVAATLFYRETKKQKDAPKVDGESERAREDCEDVAA